MDLSGITDIFGNQDFDSGSSVGLAANDMFGGGTLRQAKLAKEQMKWQSEENMKDRIHQMGIMGLQNMYYQDQANYDFNIWKNQFDLVNAWNTPSAQAKRLMDAGVNPSVLFSGQAQPAVGGMSSQSAQRTVPQVPTGGSPHSVSPVPGISGSGSPGIGILNAVTSGLRQLAEAKKVGMDTKLLEDSYDALIRKNFADAMQAENQANISSMTAEVQRANLPWDKKRGLYDSILKLSESERAYAQADVANKESALREVEKIGVDLENQFKNLRLKHGVEIVRLEMNNLRAQANRDNAAAEESRSSASLLDQKKLTEKRETRIKEAQAQISAWDAQRENDPQVQATKLANLLQSLKNDGIVESKRAEDLSKELYKVKTWNNYYGLQKQILTVLGDLSSAVNIFK